MSASLVGSEMCIRDRVRHWGFWARGLQVQRRPQVPRYLRESQQLLRCCNCLLYTSDAADDM
eukprot:2631379-Alexandrium_andersonii.AAC.1